MVQLHFGPCRVDPCVWLRKKKDKYKYIAIHVDDLLIASEEQQKITQALKENARSKSWVMDHWKTILDCDYNLDKDGTLVAQPIKYITKILELYKKDIPRQELHQWLDNHELCNEEQITKNKCMIDQLQWAITLSWYDILAQVMSMSRFRLTPQIGHLERMKRLYGYLEGPNTFLSCIELKKPDYSHGI